MKSTGCTADLSLPFQDGWRSKRGRENPTACAWSVKPWWNLPRISHQPLHSTGQGAHAGRGCSSHHLTDGSRQCTGMWKLSVRKSRYALVIQVVCCAYGFLGHIKGLKQDLAMVSSQSLPAVFSTIAFSLEILQQQRHDLWMMESCNILIWKGSTWSSNPTELHRTPQESHHVAEKNECVLSRTPHTFLKTDCTWKKHFYLK